MRGEASRAQLLAAIRSHPGLHLRGLERQLPWSFGRLRHHLAQLERRGLVRTETTDGYLRYFAADVPGHLRAVTSALRQRQTRRILTLLLDGPGLRASDVARRLDLAPSTVSAYVARLRRMGLVRDGLDGLALVQPDAVRQALGQVEPTAFDRLVDSAIAIFDDADKGRA